MSTRISDALRSADNCFTGRAAAWETKSLINEGKEYHLYPFYRSRTPQLNVNRDFHLDTSPMAGAASLNLLLNMNLEGFESHSIVCTSAADIPSPLSW